MLLFWYTHEPVNFGKRKRIVVHPSHSKDGHFLPFVALNLLMGFQVAGLGRAACLLRLSWLYTLFGHVGYVALRIR